MKLKGKIWVEGYALEEDYDEVSEGAGKIKEEGDDESEGDGGSGWSGYWTISNLQIEKLFGFKEKHVMRASHGFRSS